MKKKVQCIVILLLTYALIGGLFFINTIAANERANKTQPGKKPYSAFESASEGGENIGPNFFQDTTHSIITVMPPAPNSILEAIKLNIQLRGQEISNNIRANLGLPMIVRPCISW